MNRVKRNDRIGAMVKILTDRPNHIYSLNYFSEMFETAKSTISEDIAIIKGILERFKLGDLETVVGAAGGVRFIPKFCGSKACSFIEDICKQLSEPERILPGGFIYMADILYSPQITQRFGEILASQFYDDAPDFVITVETKGIPIAMMTARALNCPVVVARRDNKVTEGSSVSINYVSASSKRIQTMSLVKRAVQEGQRGLIIDDFMRGGGTVRGLMELMSEFNADVVGVGVVISTDEPQKKMIDNYKSLMVLKEVDEENKVVVIEPAPWVKDF